MGRKGKWRTASGRGGLVLVVAHSRFIRNIIVFFLLRNFKNILSAIINSYSIQFLRLLKEFFGVMFKMQAQQSDNHNSVAGGESKILLSCVGAGYVNINKTMV